MTPVDPARHRLMRDLVHRAASLDASERRGFVERAAGGDVALVTDVMTLLDSDAVATRAVLPAAPASALAVHLEPGTLLDGLRIEREIGRGGMGVVYEAVEVVSGRAVAVKVILPSLFALPAVRERFSREARLGLAIEHENVVRTLSFGEARVGPETLHYFVMELVRGRTLRRLVDELRTLPEALWREVAVQAARGLASLHAAGVVHRDVKPENVLLSDDRRVRIMDLGVAKAEAAAAGAELTSEGQFVGSMRYASPEQCAGRPVGPASDLYSLGAVLYELATGRPPFDAGDALTLLRAKAESAPAPLVERAPAYSDFASAVVDTLLDREPERRFGASAASLVRALEEADGGAWWGTTARAPRRRADREDAPELPLVGRGRERDVLLDAWRAARRGEGHALLVEGEAGIGKSRLVRELLAVVRDERAEVLRSGFVPAGRGGRAEDALLVRFGETALEGELSARLGGSDTAGEALAAHLLARPARPGLESLRGDAVDAQVIRVARSLCDEAPLLWVVEDLHFADADARRLVLSLARGLAGRRALIVVTTRPGLDPETLAAFGAIRGGTRLALGRLGEDGVCALASEALRDGALGRHFAQRLFARADGVPLFVLALLRDLERSGHLVRDASGAVREGRQWSDVGAPVAVLDLLRARLSALSPAERRILDAASVEGFEFDPGLVASVLERPRLEVLEALGRVEREEGIVRSGPRLVRFDHHLLQEVLYADLAPAMRAELHARLADAIAASAPDAPRCSEHRVRVIRHRLAGPDPASVAGIVHEVSIWLGDQARYHEAFALTSRALAATAGQTGKPRIGLLLEGALLSATMGRATDVAPLLDEAGALAEALGDPGVVARVTQQRASEASALGRFEDALRLAAAAEAGFRAVGNDKSTFDAVSMRGLALWSLGRSRDAIAAHEEALEIAQSLASPIPLARAASDLAIVLMETGHFAEAELHLRAALETLEKTGEVFNVATVATNLANTLQAIGRYADAIPLYERSIAATRKSGQRRSEAAAWVNLGEARLRLGDLAGAREAYRLCAELCRESFAPRTGAYASQGLGAVAQWLGDRVEGRRRYEESLAARRRMAARPGIADSCLGLGILDREEGRLAEAREHLAEALRLADEVGDPSTAALAALHLAFLPGGDADGARRRFEAAGKRLFAHAKLEGRLLAYQLAHDPNDLAEARRLLDEQSRLVPTDSRNRFFEHVPYVRGIVEAASGGDPSRGDARPAG